MRPAVFASDDSSQSPVSLILILMVKHIVNNWGGGGVRLVSKLVWNLCMACDQFKVASMSYHQYYKISTYYVSSITQLAFA